MPQLHRSERALKLFADAARQQYVCRTCRAHRTRSFHSSYPSHAPRGDRPLLTRLRESIFGSTEATPADQKREEASRERTKELAKSFDPSKPLESRKPSNKDELYDVAAVIDPAVNSDYVPATTWEALERVGSEQWARAREDEGEVYNGFAPQKQAQLTNSEWHHLLHNILVEALVLRRAGRPIDQLWYPRAKATFAHTMGVRIEPGTDGTEIVLPQNSKVEQKILQAIPETMEGPAERILLKGREGLLSKPESGLQSGAPWLNTRLDDDRMKLAIAKRITQLTGRRIPDPVISNATDVESLFDALKLKEKPQKLAKTAELQGVGINLPNVEVHSKRQTVVHKEKRVGRWKVIKAELEARDLPVTGNRWPQSKTMIDPRPSNLERKFKRMQKA